MVEVFCRGIAKPEQVQVRPRPITAPAPALSPGKEPANPRYVSVTGSRHAVCPAGRHDRSANAFRATRVDGARGPRRKFTPGTSKRFNGRSYSEPSNQRLETVR
jgi:hypothetical protein